MSDDCCPNTGVLSVDAALSQLQRAACTVLPKVDDILLTQALGRILAQDVVSSLDVPPQANSAMDFYRRSDSPRGKRGCDARKLRSFGRWSR